MDITMCRGEVDGKLCPFMKNCWRHIANSNPYRQSYFVKAPLEEDENGNPECEYYWPVTGGKVR